MRAAFLAILLCVPLLAEAPKEVADRILKQFDKDNDGRITKGTECTDEELFKRYDGPDKDGVITRAEIEAVEDPAAAKKRAARTRKPRGVSLMMEFDEEGKGQLTPKEFSKWMFNELDEDGTGHLTPEELQRAYVPMKLRGGAHPFVSALKNLDRDKDGTVDAEEWEVPKAYFDTIDHDKDGGISKEEMVMSELEAIGGLPGFSGVDMFAQRDKDHDKELESNEFEGPRELFDRIDMDKDGKISVDEFQAYMDRIRRVMRNADDPVFRFDLNGDGDVTRAEFPGSDAAFDRLDTDHDGVIDERDRAARK